MHPSNPKAKSSSQVNTLSSPTLADLEALPRLPFHDSSRQLRIALIANERPAFFVDLAAGRIVVSHMGSVFDQGFGVFQVAVDGLYSCCHTILLFHGQQEHLTWEKMGLPSPFGSVHPKF